MIATLRSALQRREGDVPAPALAAVAGVAALGYAASLGALLGRAAVSPAQLLAVLALLGAPLAVGPAMLPGRTSAGLRRVAVLVVALLQVVLTFQLGRLGDGTLLAAAFCAAQGHALARATHAGAAALSLAVAMAQSTSALRVESSDAGMVALVAQLVLALVALALMHAVGARRLAARNRRLAPSLPEPTRSAADRTRYALRLGACLALPALGMLAVGARLGNGSWIARASDPQRPDAPEDPAAAATTAGPDAGATEPGLWRDRMGFGEEVGRLSDEVVLWARPRTADAGRGLRAARGLWLAVLALDTFGDDGLSNPRLDRARPIADGDDGEQDGWVLLDEAEGELLDLEIVQRPLRVAASVGDVLVRSRPLVAIQAERVLHDPDGVLVLPEPSEDWFRYRTVSRAPWGLAPPAPGAQARHPDPRFTQLPPRSAELDRLAAEAGRLLDGARDDAERVERLLRHFEREFDYSLQGSGFAGLRGVRAFLESRRGYCTSFAAAAVLLLRTQGVACRAVGGYLAHEWDPAQEAFVVRGRHAHAWIEVHFEGLGWRSFDPTPARQREAAFDRATAGDAPGVSEWGTDLALALRDAVLDDGPAGAVQRVGRVLAQAPAVVAASVGRRPLAWVVALSLALLVVAALGRARLRRTLRRAGLRLPGEPPPVGAYERILALLARHGLVPGEAETLREFSRRVVASAHLPADVQRATEVFYRARFGGLEPGPDERAFLEDLLARVRTALVGPRA